MADRRTKNLWMVEDEPTRGDDPPRSYWTKIGVAFENSDGSWSLEMMALPVSGRVVMRDPELVPGQTAPKTAYQILQEIVETVREDKDVESYGAIRAVLRENKLL